MRRRRFLRALPATAALAAGCLARDSPDDAENGTNGTDATETTVDDWTENIEGRDPDGFPPRGSDHVDTVVWYRENRDAPIALEPSAAEGDLPVAEFAFALRNDTDQTFSTNFYDWSLSKRVDGEWFRVAPRMVPEPLMSLAPGEDHRWTLAASSERPDPKTDSVADEGDVSVRGLGAGTYAFAVDGWFEDGDHEQQVVFAARFELAGDPVALTPSAAVREAARDGDVVTVQADGSDHEDAREATYVLERVEDPAEEPRELITEQAIRRWPLCDALAHVEAGVRTVRVESTTGTVPAFGVHDDAPPIRYGGDAFRASVEDPNRE
ncbi:hypothetical protein G9464_08110 [Halostella sp. JP-L12]|uniref:hypothetical protein n=1 Tax=Halostella TaxID=1843185 RepID=UPI000EF78343|nr:MULTISPECIES: hypothetical protein [Halostella]NHN47559.1 hypothetical protein [Halostella sp. JP-L12]